MLYLERSVAISASYRVDEVMMRRVQELGRNGFYDQEWMPVRLVDIRSTSRLSAAAQKP
jgi:hypothetical protein